MPTLPETASAAKNKPLRETPLSVARWNEPLPHARFQLSGKRDSEKYHYLAVIV
jgi:hypothetical protein